PFPALADTVTGDKGGDMLVDLIVLRPLGLVTTVVGATVFVLGLPFTLPGGQVGESACALVTRPAAYTFSRPLGDLEECSRADCRPCPKDTGDSRPGLSPAGPNLPVAP
ncbi:MAG: hypothetical protein PHR30_18915, partial [Gallionellaceae bacterium]|nr:hypothetical protein [Gallionellaceae bacterium]